MPYKNKEDYDKFVADKYVARITVRIPREQEVFYKAMTKACENTSMSSAEFLRFAAHEKLIRDGYLPGKLD